MFRLFAAAGFLLVFAGSSAVAGGTLVDKFYDAAGTSVIFAVTLETSAAEPEKAAAIDIKYQHTDDNYKFDGTYVDLTVTFATAAEWQKFVAVWAKARAARGDTDAGDYFADGTLLNIAAQSDGDIAFTIAGHPNSKNRPKDVDIFYLQPKDFAGFDGMVGKVSAYFAK
jgi:hypothetical protein